MLGSWDKVINTTLLNNTLTRLEKVTNICPERNLTFRAFKLCPLERCMVIFIGQDVYPQKGVATGLAFGNKKGSELSPSLLKLKEAAIDYTFPHTGPIRFDETLEDWASQGVLLINAALTCELNKIGSHLSIWRPFIADFLMKLSNYDDNFIFVLLGNEAQSFEPYINAKKSIILKEKHPSYYVRNGLRMPSTIFDEINRHLFELYCRRINWYYEDVF